jgi:hypothetical protein
MTLVWEKISGKDAIIGGKILNKRGKISKIALRKTLRADGDLARIATMAAVGGG